MDIAEEIKTLFADGDIDAAYQIEGVAADCPAWVVRFWDSFGVAVPYDGEDVSEEFANASLYSYELNLGGRNQRCLLLTSSVEVSRNEFAVFCRDFVYPGKDNRSREELTGDPASWWKRWKNLIGNSIMEKYPYAVLGELITYEYLLSSGKTVNWEGPKSASHDLVSPDAEYEVKSTLSRYDKLVHISGQFQLQNSAKRLFLYFCRFERNLNGICINDMVEKLVNMHGESREELNAKLNQLGYGIGNSDRMEKYQIHEVLRYPVDERFPKITPEMFKKETLPTGIKRLSYDVDLSVMVGQKINMISD